MKYYNLVVWSGVSPERFGPYPGEDEQLAAARSLAGNLNIEGEDSLFALDVDDDGEPAVWPYGYRDLAAEQP